MTCCLNVFVQAGNSLMFAGTVKFGATGTGVMEAAFTKLFLTTNTSTLSIWWLVQELTLSSLSPTNSTFMDPSEDREVTPNCQHTLNAPSLISLERVEKFWTVWLFITNVEFKNKSGATLRHFLSCDWGVFLPAKGCWLDNSLVEICFFKLFVI